MAKSGVDNVLAHPLQDLISFFDADYAVRNASNFLWTTFTRFEPASEIYARETKVNRHHVSYNGPLVIDALIKPWYPGVVTPDDETVKRVDSRWSELFKV